MGYRPQSDNRNPNASKAPPSANQRRGSYSGGPAPQLKTLGGVTVFAGIDSVPVGNDKSASRKVRQANTEQGQGSRPTDGIYES